VILGAVKTGIQKKPTAVVASEAAIHRGPFRDWRRLLSSILFIQIQHRRNGDMPVSAAATMTNAF
jgi:hypothetical protein